MTSLPFPSCDPRYIRRTHCTKLQKFENFQAGGMRFSWMGKCSLKRAFEIESCVRFACHLMHKNGPKKRLPNLATKIDCDSLQGCLIRLRPPFQCFHYLVRNWNVSFSAIGGWPELIWFLASRLCLALIWIRTHRPWYTTAWAPNPNGDRWSSLNSSSFTFQRPHLRNTQKLE